MPQNTRSLYQSTIADFIQRDASTMPRVRSSNYLDEADAAR